MDSSKNIYQVKSSYLMELDGIRREKNLSWDDTFNLEEVHLESGTGSPELETDVHIINSNPAWKGLLESQSQRKGGSNNFCDVHIHASDGYIPVHRVFLQNKSEFLDNLIKENLRVSMPQCSNHSANLISISLMDVKLVHLKTVMVLLYTGVAVIKEKDEHDIKNVIRMLQMENNVKVEKEVHDPSVKRKKKDLRCFYSIEENMHVSGGSSNNCHPPQGAPSGTGRLRTTSGASSTPSVSSAKPSDVPSFIPPEIAKVPPGTFTKKRTERVQRNLESTGDVDEQQQPGSSENAVVNNNQLPRHPDMPPEIRKVPPGTLLPLGKQPRIIRPSLPTRGRGRGRGRGRERGGGGRTSGMTTRNAFKRQADDEDSNGPKSRYEMDNEYVPSDEPNEEDDDNVNDAMEVSEDELEQGPTCSTRKSSRSRSKSKDPSFANEDENCPSKRYPKRRRKDSSSAGPFKETQVSSSGADAPATIADMEPGPSITRDHLETLKRLSGEGVHNYTGHRCFFCGDIFEEEPVLIAHLKSSCAKLIDSMYDLRKKHCKACHTFFLNYSASDFMDHVSTCCVGKRIRGKSASNEGPVQTAEPASSNVVVGLNIATQEPGSFPETVVLPELCLIVDRLEDDEIILFIDKLKRREEIAITLPKLGRGHKYVEWKSIEEPTPPANAPAAPPETITAEPPTNVPSPPQETTTGEPPASSITSEIVRPAVENEGLSRNISAFEPPYSSTPNEFIPNRSRPGPKSAKWKEGPGLEIKNKPGPKSSKMAKPSNEKNKEVETRKEDQPVSLSPPAEPENICPPPRTNNSAAAKLRASLKMKLGPKANLCLRSRVRTSTLGSSAIEESPTNDSITSATEVNSTLVTTSTSVTTTTAKLASAPLTTNATSPAKVSNTPGTANVSTLAKESSTPKITNASSPTEVASEPKTTKTTSFAKVSSTPGTGNVASLENESNEPVITNVTSSAKVSTTPGTTNVIKETSAAPVKPRGTPLAVNAAKESVAPVRTQNQLQTAKVGPQHCLRSAQVGPQNNLRSVQVDTQHQQQSVQVGAQQKSAQVGAHQQQQSAQVGAQHNLLSAQVGAQQQQHPVQMGAHQQQQSAQVGTQHQQHSVQVGAHQQQQSAQVGTQHQQHSVQVGAHQQQQSAQVGAHQQQQSAQVGAHQQQHSVQQGAQQQHSVQVGAQHHRQSPQHHLQSAQVGAQHNLRSAQVDAQHQPQSAQVGAHQQQHSVQVGAQHHRQSPQHHLQSAQVGTHHNLNLRSVQMGAQHHGQSAQVFAPQQSVQVGVHQQQHSVQVGAQQQQQSAHVGAQHNLRSAQHHHQSAPMGSQNPQRLAQEGAQQFRQTTPMGFQIHQQQHHQQPAQMGAQHRQPYAQVGGLHHQQSVQLGAQHNLQSVQAGAQHYRQSTQMGQNHLQSAQVGPQNQHQPGLQMTQGQPVVQIGPQQQVHTQFMSSISAPPQPPNYTGSALIPHQGYHNRPVSNPSSMVTYNLNPQQQLQNATTTRPQTAQPMTVALQNQCPQQNTQLNMQGTITQYSVISSSISQQNYVTPAAIAAGVNEGLGLPPPPVQQQQQQQQFPAPNSVALYRPDQNMSYAQATLPAITSNNGRDGVRTTVRLPVSPQMNPLANGRQPFVNLLQRQESQVVAAEPMSRNEHVGTAMLPISRGSLTVANQSGTVATGYYAVDPGLEHRQLAIEDVKPVIFVGPEGKIWQEKLERRPSTNLTCPGCNLAFQTPETLRDHLCI